MYVCFILLGLIVAFGLALFLFLRSRPRVHYYRASPNQTYKRLPQDITAEETASDLSVEELKTVAQSIRAVEDALLNVRIDSNSWLEHAPSSSGPWERTPVCLVSTAFFENTSSNRVKLDIHKIVLEWKDGAAPYLEESYSVSFDGVQGRRKAISSSHSGKTVFSAALPASALKPALCCWLKCLSLEISIVRKSQLWQVLLRGIAPLVNGLAKLISGAVEKMFVAYSIWRPCLQGIAIL